MLAVEKEMTIPKGLMKKTIKLPHISLFSDSTAIILVHILPEFFQCSHIQVYHILILHIHILKLSHIYLLSFHYIFKIQSFPDQGNSKF